MRADVCPGKGSWDYHAERGRSIMKPECGKRDERFSPIQFLHNSGKD